MNESIVTQEPGRYLLFNAGVSQDSCDALVEYIFNAYKDNCAWVHVGMSSEGGQIGPAIMAHNVIKELPIPITMHNLSFVDSAALTIYLAGDTRLMVSNASFLMHGVQTDAGMGLDVHQLKALHQKAERLNDQFKDFLTGNDSLNIPASAVSGCINNGMVVTVDMAEEWGLATRGAFTISKGSPVGLITDSGVGAHYL